MDPAAEQTIARGLREGRSDAWQALYDAYARPVWQAVARQMGATSGEVADVVQETFLAAARSARQFDPARGSLAMWLGGIARRQVALHFRRRRHAAGDRASGDGAAGPAAIRWLADGQPAPGEAAARKELAGRVSAALAELPLDYESLLRAKYFDGASVVDLAGQEASSETAVRSKLARARRAFRDVFLRDYEGSAAGTPTE